MDDAARFLGVDVGTSRLLAASIDFTVDPPVVRFAPSAEHAKVIDWVRSAEPTSVAIDAPSSWSNGLRRRENRRVVDALFGLRGRHATPGTATEAPVWMQVGVPLHRQLTELLGLERVFEFHPTEAFRSLLGVHFAAEPQRVVCDPKRRLLPKRPRSRGGHDQRVALVTSLLSEWGVVMPSEEALDDIDRVDALMGACLGCLRARGQVHQVGDARDGLVVIASDRDMAALLDDVPPSSGRSRPSLAPVPPKGIVEDIDGFALPLGEHGPGGLDLHRTLETLATRPEGNAFFPVTLHGRLGGTDRPPPFDLVLYSTLGDGVAAMRAMLRVTHVYTPHDGMSRVDLMGERDPWPADLAADEVQWLEYEHAVVYERDLAELVVPDAPPDTAATRFAFSWLPGRRPSPRD